MQNRILFGCGLCFSLFLSPSYSQEMAQKDFLQVKDGYNIWARLGVLYLIPHEKFIVCTNQITNINSIVDITKTPLLKTHFQWNFGSLLEGGYFFADSLWDVKAQWIYYASQTRQHKNTLGPDGGQGCFPIWSLDDDILSTDYVGSAHMLWQLNVNLLECNCSYHYSYKKFSLFPFFGLSSSWIDQRFKPQYSGGIFTNGPDLLALNDCGSDDVFIKNDFWGIGPQLGVTAKLFFSKFLGLSLRGAGSLEYSIIRVKENETYLQSTRFHQHHVLQRARGIIDGSMSVFGKCFLKNDRVSLLGDIGWNFFFFPHQVEWKRDPFHLIQNNRNLSLMGISCSLRLDF
jgi:hypothetical protein